MAVVKPILCLAALMATAAAPLPTIIDGVPIGAIPKQALPKQGCAAYLWSGGQTHALVAMASADPAQLRLSLAGTITDLSRTGGSGPGALGFAETTTYQAGDTTAVLDMTVTPQPDLSQGALVQGATLTLEPAGRDSFVVPVGGLVGCAPGTATGG